jgi:pyrroline-5-carboxylate reductase
VRTMPNTPALVGMGITGMFAAPAVSAEQRAAAERVMRAVGEVVWIKEEALIDPVTAISGSGPAYVFYFLEALAEAGTQLGLDAHDAKRLALATFAGAAKLAADSPDDFATLRTKVTSKGGTTAAALAVMADQQVKEAIIAAAHAASARGREMGEQLGQG